MEDGTRRSNRSPPCARSGSHHIPRAWHGSCAGRWRVTRSTSYCCMVAPPREVAAVALPGGDRSSSGSGSSASHPTSGSGPPVVVPHHVANRVDGAVALTPDLGEELRRLGYLGPIWNIANYRTPNASRPSIVRPRRRLRQGDRRRRRSAPSGSSVTSSSRSSRAGGGGARGGAKQGERTHLVLAGDGPRRARSSGRDAGARPRRHAARPTRRCGARLRGRRGDPAHQRRRGDPGRGHRGADGRLSRGVLPARRGP